MFFLGHGQKEGDREGNDHGQKEHAKPWTDIGDAGNKAWEGEGAALCSRKSCNAATAGTCNAGGKHGTRLTYGYAKEGGLRHAEGAGESRLIGNVALLLILCDKR